MSKLIIKSGCMLLGLFCFAPMVFAEPGKADIAITDITVNSNCNVVVSLKNVGSTPLPLSADDPGYGTFIQFYKGTAPAGGYTFTSELRQPGSTATSTATILQIKGSETITAEYSSHGAYIDTNPADNRMTKTLTCTPPVVPKPDLTITSVDFTQDCRPVVRLANIGNASLASYEFSAFALQRVVDNLRTGVISMSTIDSYGRLKSPQGTAEWIDGKEYLPQNTIGYYLTSSTNVVLNDGNFQNNSATVTVPARCKTGAPVLRKGPQPAVQPRVIPKQPLLKP